MKLTKILIAFAVVAFLVAGLPGSTTAEHVTPADGSPSDATQVTDAGTGTGPAMVCTVSPNGTIVCPPCEAYPPYYCM